MNNLNNNICNGGVLQLYQEGINGRLNPQEGCDFPHLINTPNRLRRVLLDELELWDYDMSNSHLSMFLGLCERYDLRCPNIGEYVGNKSVLRDEWSYEFNVKTKDLKQYIISWLYGNHMNEIKKAIKINASPRHVPSKIISILDIPKTKNGKLVELAVKQSIEGDMIKNLEALANPDSLKQFKNIKELYE